MKNLFLLFLLIIIAAGGYIWWANNRIVEIVEPETNSQENFSETQEITPEEQEFLDSGRAKATEDESDLWMVYENPEVGFSFSYPPEVILLTDDMTIHSEQIYLDLDIRDIGEQTVPTDLDYDQAMENIQDLAGGEFGTAYGFAFKESEQVKSVGFLFVQDYMVLARFEVCDIALERKLRFYFNNKQITLTLIGPEQTLLETMPEYFTLDEVNCGDDKMWNFDKQTDFYNTLVAGQASEEIQNWYNIFDDMSEKILFDHR